MAEALNNDELIQQAPAMQAARRPLQPNGLYSHNLYYVKSRIIKNQAVPKRRTVLLDGVQLRNTADLGSSTDNNSSSYEKESAVV